MFKVKVIRNMKKISALMLSAILIFNMLPSIAVFAFDNEDGEEISPGTQSENIEESEKTSIFSDDDKKWYNEEDTGLYISSEEEIKYLAYLVNLGKDSFEGKTIFLKNDITMQGTFVSIGKEDNPFKGIFNGNGHCISGGSISGEKNIGFFGVIREAEILNLNIMNIELISNDDSNNIGCLVGTAFDSTIESCKNLGVNIDSGKDNIGGIVGCSYDGYISNCISQCEIKAEGDCVGGIVGYNEGIIANCVNNRKITGKLTDDGNKQNFVGGIAGYSKNVKDEDTGNNEREEITDCKNYGEIICNYSEYVSGIVGKTDMPISESENHGRVKSEHDYVGGIAGYAKVEIADCKNSGEIVGNSCVGGIVGQSEIDISGCSNSGNVAGKKDNIGGITGCAESSVDNCENSGNVNGSSKNVGGIVGYTESPISICTNSGEIKGKIDKADGDNNVNIIDNVGGIVGYTKSSVDNCKNSGNVNGSSRNTGGIVGCAEGPISICTNSGGIEGESDNVGGVVGYAKNSVSDCTNAGKVKGSTKNIGGVVGSNENIVSNCTNNATVEGTGKSTGNDQDNGKHIGGIVGYARNDINGCTNNGRIDGENDNVGGIVGSISNLKITNCKNYGYICARRSIGGIVGDAGNTNIESCENNGNVNSKEAESGEGNGTHVGGIVGYAINVNIRKSTNRGNIEGSDNVAGISGYIKGEGVKSYDKNYGIYNCTNEGQVSGHSDGNTNVGGIVGYGEEVQVECVNKGKILGYYYVGGITGSTSNCTVKNCTNFGEIRGWEDVGGIAGTFKGSSVKRNYLGRNQNKGNVYGNSKYDEIAGYYTSSHTHYYNNDKDGSKNKIKNKTDIWSGHTDITDNTPAQVKSVTPVAKQSVAAPVMMVSKSLLPVVKTPYEETNTAEQSDTPNKLDESKNIPSNSAKSISEDESEEEATTFFSNLFNYIKGHLKNLWKVIEKNIDKIKEFLKNNWDRIVENIDKIKNRVQSLAESYILRK